ncbi:MAG: GNAT family N-acetyltransferase [Vicingaceae bacterium]|nr:GNAT family N-acetyltransferase [Vicingaceae bacterium]
MNLQKSNIENIPRIMEIVKDAQSYLARLNIDQWQDGYPDQNQIELDIKQNDSYIVLNEKNIIIGTTVFTTKTEPTYKKIDGNWITLEGTKYGVIHRLAVGDDYRKLGLAKFVFSECENKLKELGVTSMRIDTHSENMRMQHMLKKRGYEYCGVIKLERGGERLAYEKIINKI